MLPIQEELQANGLDSVVVKYALKHRRHTEHPNLVLFKYDQIDSPVGERAVHDCRALILDESNNWAVVSFPYRRFFNHGEAMADEIHWPSARVFEKEDGSLITLYWYGGRWHASTSGVPDGSAPIGQVYGKAGTGGTFANAFWDTLADRLPSEDSRHMCFMFELCTMANRIIVEHPEPRVVLHGARDLRTLEEVDPEPLAERFRWEMCRSYPLGSIDEVLAAAAVLKPNESEGYVVRDARFNRVKIKAPQYVALHHAANGNGTRRILELVRTGESAEWLAYFPQMKTEHERLSTEYRRLCDDAECDFQRIQHIATQKDFAAEAVKTRYSAALFKRRQGKSVSSTFAEMPIKNLCSLMGVEDTAPVE